MFYADRKFGTLSIDDFYFESELSKYYDVLLDVKLNYIELSEDELPNRPARKPINLAYALATFQKANDNNTLYRLRDARIMHGLSQRQLAKMMGVTQQAIAKFESPNADPKLSTLRAYANAIGMQIGHDLTLLANFNPNWKALEAEELAALDAQEDA